jgi:hypothetical protein
MHMQTVGWPSVCALPAALLGRMPVAELRVRIAQAVAPFLRGA